MQQPAGCYGHPPWNSSSTGPKDAYSTRSLLAGAAHRQASACSPVELSRPSPSCLTPGPCPRNGTTHWLHRARVRGVHCRVEGNDASVLQGSDGAHLLGVLGRLFPPPADRADKSAHSWVAGQGRDRRTSALKSSGHGMISLQGREGYVQNNPRCWSSEVAGLLVPCAAVAGWEGGQRQLGRQAARSSAQPVPVAQTTAVWTPHPEASFREIGAC